MHSPLLRSAQHPLSTEVKRGVTRFFGIPEKGDGGMSTCLSVAIFKFFINP